MWSRFWSGTNLQTERKTELDKSLCWLTVANERYVNGEKIGKGKIAELRHGAELSLGVKSAASAKKGSHKGTYVAFIYKSNSGLEEDVHAAFLEEGGPAASYECSKVSTFCLLCFFFLKKSVSQALGSGAFAEVRLCFHRRTGAKYAAKIVDKNKFALNKELRKVRVVPCKEMSLIHDKGLVSRRGRDSQVDRFSLHHSLPRHF